MKEVFKKVQASCVICKTPVNGKYRIGNDFYCYDDYQQKKELPDDINRQKKINKDKQIFSGTT